MVFSFLIQKAKWPFKAVFKTHLPFKTLNWMWKMDVLNHSICEILISSYQNEKSFTKTKT